MNLQLLDFSALEHNARFFKNLLGSAKLCAVVKNDAYGHGIVHVARYLDNLADCFAVGSADEAEKLSFTNKDILILLPQSEESTVIATRKGYVLTVDSFETLDVVKRVANRLDAKIRVHIKLDSGMSRLGFTAKDVEKLCGALKDNSLIGVEGVFSHFYGENVSDCDKQYAEFIPLAKRVEKAVNKRLVKHIANSAGTLLSRKYCLDMARVGLGLYGYGNPNLIPVKTVTAKVISVKNVKKGDVVGYGAKYIARRDIRVATLGVGYAQGFARSLVGADVLINGVKRKVIAVCMAMIMVDVDDDEVNVGDNVTLLGSGVNIANDAVSIYELLCNLK